MQLTIVCCKEMQLSLEDPRDNIGYNPIFREFYIQTKRKTVILDILFCPWCGVRLSKSLRDEFFDILEDEHNISTDISDYKTNLQIPSEFKSDEWWKRREL